MNQGVNDMITYNIILMKIVIKSKAEINYGTTWTKTSEPCDNSIFKAKFCQSDSQVILNVRQIIKIKGHLQCV